MGEAESLPNLIYTDGNEFSVWHDGELQAEVSKSGIVKLSGDIRSAGASLTAPPELQSALGSFFEWKPTAPRNARELALMSARLCRLLCDEVIEKLKADNKEFADLRADWRQILFPEADDNEFADGYAQAVVFGLLMARARGVSLADGINRAASDLRSTDSLIGTALATTTNPETLSVSLRTLLSTGRWGWQLFKGTAMRGSTSAVFLEKYDSGAQAFGLLLHAAQSSKLWLATDEALRDPKRLTYLEDCMTRWSCSTLRLAQALTF